MSARSEPHHPPRLHQRTVEVAQMVVLGLAIGYLTFLLWASTPGLPGLFGGGGSGYQVIKGSFRVDSHADFSAASEQRIPPIHN